MRAVAVLLQGGCSSAVSRERLPMVGVAVALSAKSSNRCAAGGAPAAGAVGGGLAAQSDGAARGYDSWPERVPKTAAAAHAESARGLCGFRSSAGSGGTRSAGSADPSASAQIKGDCPHPLCSRRGGSQAPGRVGASRTRSWLSCRSPSCGAALGRSAPSSGARSRRAQGPSRLRPRRRRPACCSLLGTQASPTCRPRAAS